MQGKWEAGVKIFKLEKALVQRPRKEIENVRY